MQDWLDYQKVGSPEAKFVFQVDRIENLLEALEIRYLGNRDANLFFGFCINRISEIK